MYHSLGTHRNAASKVFGHPLHCRFKSIWAPTALSVASKAFGHSLHCRIKSIWAPTALSHQNYLRGTHYIVASKIFGHPLPQLLHQNVWAPTALSHQKHLGTNCIVASKSTAVFGHPLHQLSHQKPRYLDTHCISCRIKSIRTPTALSHQKPRYLDTHCIVASKALGHPLHCRIKSHGIWTPTAALSLQQYLGTHCTHGRARLQSTQSQSGLSVLSPLTRFQGFTELFVPGG